MSNDDASEAAEHAVRQMPMAAPLDTLRPGDGVLVVSLIDQSQLRGLVEEIAPKLDVIWVRDHQLGERRLFTASDNAILKESG